MISQSPKKMDRVITTSYIHMTEKTGLLLQMDRLVPYTLICKTFLRRKFISLALFHTKT